MKAKIILFISIAVMCCTFFCGCHTSQRLATTIPYTVADRYFVRNDVSGLPPTTIYTSQPLLLLIVDKKHEKPVVLEAEGK